MKEKIEELFRAADRNPKCNTAYPIFKKKFQRYEADCDIMEGVSELSYYIHIPFCSHLCNFCEYTRFQAGDKSQEDRYLELLTAQIREFTATHPVSKVYGLDIGGGTPSALDVTNFEKILKLANSLLEGDPDKGITAPAPAEDLEKSIEISFTTINEEKISLIGAYGFKRVSAGIQSMSRSLLEKQGRAYNGIQEIAAYMKALYAAGVEKINLDLMYGMPDQGEDEINGTLDVIEMLKPQQVTIYEMRYNRMKSKPENVDRELQYDQYCTLYQRLLQMGYKSRFGKNTFTLCEDHGVSSYIWHRMDQGIPYKGFGISAQSMGSIGISYGSLKNTDLKDIPEMSAIGTSSNYRLPPEEMAAKYVSIAMYSGCFRLDALSRILGRDSREYFAEELDYLLSQEYITIHDNYVTVTEKGFRFYGAIAALFWSDTQKALLLQQEKG